MISVKPAGNWVIPLEKMTSDQLKLPCREKTFGCKQNAEAGTTIAHNDGGVPVIEDEIPVLMNIHRPADLFLRDACGG